jgi:hypothetical protein
MRDKQAAQHWHLISAVDPLNLLGIVTRDVRVPSIHGNRIAFLDGCAIAARDAGNIRWLTETDETTRDQAINFLARPAPHRIRRELMPM